MDRKMLAFIVYMNVVFWGVAGYLGSKALATRTSIDAAGRMVTYHPGSEAMLLPALAGIAAVFVPIFIYAKAIALFRGKKNPK
jgi:hypothetical protein